MIRKATADDAADIARIYNTYIESSTATFHTDPFSEEKMRLWIVEMSKKFPFFAYEEGEKVRGFCYAHSWKERPAYAATWELAIYLSDECRRRGAGTELLKNLIREASENGCHALIACITEGNDASAALHRKMGFQRVSRFLEVGVKFGRRLNVEDWELILGK